VAAAVKAALYARYSSDLQSEASIPDQFRACERIATLQGFEVVSRFEDRAISAGTAERPGYQAVLAGARLGEFDAIVAEDSSRLWRNMAEQSPRLAELSDLGVHVVTRDLDTRQESSEILGAVMGAMAAAYRKQISYRTRRGLEGLALAGKSTGGRCLGDAPGEAETVREAFRLRALGQGYGTIGAALGLPRSTVRYVLSNPRYRGQLTWGATERRGGARDSKRTRRVDRPGGPLVVREIAPLVDSAVWAACNP
jgi:DNA invertase Pin-like site-specific DNA recombinase